MPPEHPSEQAPDTPPAGVSYTLREAAEITGKARGTVRRYLDEGGRPGRFPNAFQDAEGAWRIPLTDLIAAGLSLKARYSGGAETPPVTDSAPSPAEAPRDADLIAALRAEVEYLRRANADLTALNTALVARIPIPLPAKASPWRLFGRRGDNA